MEDTVKNTQNYMNPLTLEALLFLNSLDFYSKTCHEIDENLYSILDNVLDSIGKYLDARPAQIVSTDNVALLPCAELKTIETIYHCNKCKCDLGKSPYKVIDHLQQGHSMKDVNERRVRVLERRKAKADRVSATLIKLPKKTKTFMNNGISKFFNENIRMAEILKQIPEYDAIEKELLSEIKPLFEGTSVKIYKFGSRISGIGERNSDLDMFIDIGNTFSTFENRASENTLDNLIRVRQVLTKNKKIWPQMRSIENARVPILRVIHGNTNIQCDLGFSNSLGYCNTKLIAYLFELQPLARRLCLFMKKWFERSKLKDSISTYSISLMVIYFLQLRKHLPSIERLQTDLRNTQNVGPWIGNFLELSLDELQIAPLVITDKLCKDYLIEFFNFFSDFNFHVDAICPYLGCPIEIKHIDSRMPERYSNYIKFLNDKTGAFQASKCMVVQDPIQLNHNVTKAVTPYVLKHFTDYFKQSATVLEESEKL